MQLRLEIDVRDPFLPLFAAEAPRFFVVVVHRRGGKTTASIQRLIQAALHNPPPNARYAYIAPLRHQAKTVAWDLLKNMTEGVPGREVNEAELRVDFRAMGSRITLFGSDNPDALRGQYFDGVIMDEVAQMPANTWTHVVRPALADRKGWAIFIGTPAGRNVFFDLFEQAGRLDGWSRLYLTADQTGLVDAEELEQARATMTPEAYAQEFDCDWSAAIKGAFWAKALSDIEAQGHFLHIDHDPGRQVITGWDLGTRDATAIWVAQPYRGGWGFIDFYANTGYGVDHYAGWLQQQGYLSGTCRHLAPHDIVNVDWGVAGGRSRLEVAREHGISFERIQRVANQRALMEEINAVRLLLPRCYFHDADDERGARVRTGALSLSLYRQRWNEKLNALQAEPLHDEHSHAADALRTFAKVAESRLTGEGPDGRINPHVRRPGLRVAHTTLGPRGAASNRRLNRHL
jgi:hypothetical protein